MNLQPALNLVVRLLMLFSFASVGNVQTVLQLCGMPKSGNLLLVDGTIMSEGNGRVTLTALPALAQLARPGCAVCFDEGRI